MNIFVFSTALITGYRLWWGSYGLFPVKFLVQFLSYNWSSIKVSEWLPNYCHGSWEMQEGAGSKRQSWLSKLLYSDEQQKQGVERNLVVFRRTHSVKNGFKEFHIFLNSWRLVWKTIPRILKSDQWPFAYFLKESLKMCFKIIFNWRKYYIPVRNM